MFEFHDVSYGEILDIPALSIQCGKITSLIGPSGSGKTTILRLMNKMISPTVGRILFHGSDISQLNTVLHRRRVTLLSQSPCVFDGTIRDNLTAGLRFQKRDIPDDPILNGILHKIKLMKELDSPSQTLSGGEKQRLALGRVLLLNSEVYLLDEPSSSLDEETAETVIQMIADYVRSDKKTLVMVTHSKSIAERFSDEIVSVSCGKCSWRPA